MSTDYFQNRSSYEGTRRGLEAPRDRERGRTGSLPLGKGAQSPQPAPAHSITWGTTVKITLAIYFAIMMVLVTLSIVGFVVLRLAVGFAGDQLEELKINWQTTSSPVSTATP
ncbi:hypothetical protein [Kineosporia sp. NBRC 101731]|uniref:hypothetical protein n=1 Tax=Kineosporia sp. NBRC 101731 TaxID=3032199 RepID=UPI0024A18E40|nr:hypothetical protein [Kineosporia sp. NBRC 101731]GLY32975.1 hypothetical protein Kisp02_63400 [Kineosporia sp. NBRC 101731]